MALKTLTANSGQNVQNWRNSQAFRETVKKLAAENALAVRGEEAQKRVVKVIDDYVAKVPHGEKEKAREALCKEAGIKRRSFTRWKTEVEQRAEIGDSLFEKAAELDYDITASSIRSLANAKRLNPGASHEEIVRKAARESSGIAEAPKAAKVEADPIIALGSALSKYLEATDNNVPSLLAAIQNQGIPPAKLCPALKKVCRK